MSSPKPSRQDLSSSSVSSEQMEVSQTDTLQGIWVKHMYYALRHAQADIELHVDQEWVNS